MNIFEFFSKLTHPDKRKGWVETTAYFTGDRRKTGSDRISRRAHYPKMLNVTSDKDFFEYAVKYYVEDIERTGWYLFYPAPDPDAEEIKGEKMKIRYMKKRPWIFESFD